MTPLRAVIHAALRADGSDGSASRLGRACLSPPDHAVVGREVSLACRTPIDTGLPREDANRSIHPHPP